MASDGEFVEFDAARNMFFPPQPAFAVLSTCEGARVKHDATLAINVHGPAASKDLVFWIGLQRVTALRDFYRLQCAQTIRENLANREAFLIEMGTKKGRYRLMDSHADEHSPLVTTLAWSELAERVNSREWRVRCDGYWLEIDKEPYTDAQPRGASANTETLFGSAVECHLARMAAAARSGHFSYTIEGAQALDDAARQRLSMALGVAVGADGTVRWL